MGNMSWQWARIGLPFLAFGFLISQQVENLVRDIKKGYLFANSAHASPSAQHATPHAYVSASLIWSGSKLLKQDIESLQSMRKNYQQLPVIHLINPVYFIEKDQHQNTATLKSLIKPLDHVGIYLAPHPKMLNMLNIKERYHPNLWGLNSPQCASACVRSTMLKGYSDDELAKMVSWSKAILAQFLGMTPNFFMSHDWSADPKLSEILAKNSIGYNMNAINPQMLRERLEGFPLWNELKRDWDVIDATSPMQTFYHNTSVTLVPQVNASLDYASPSELIKNYQQFEQASLKAPELERMFNLTLYHDTASVVMPRFDSVLAAIMNTTSSLDSSPQTRQLQFLPPLFTTQAMK